MVLNSKSETQTPPVPPPPPSLSIHNLNRPSFSTNNMVSHSSSLSNLHENHKNDKDREDVEEVNEEEEESFVKTWNLRPRKPVTKTPMFDNDRKARPEGVDDMARPRVTEKKIQIPSFALTEQEIEEDFILMTGAKPPRKPIKRPRMVQSQLDAGFPGLCISNPKSYQVPDPPVKD